MRSCSSASQGKAQGTLTPCLSPGRFGVSNKKKGNEVLAQMAPEELVVSFLRSGSTFFSTRNCPGTLRPHISFTEETHHSKIAMLMSDKVLNICKHRKILWSQTLPINYTWPLFIWCPRAPHVTRKAGALVCLQQWLQTTHNLICFRSVISVEGGGFGYWGLRCWTWGNNLWKIQLELIIWT